LTRALLLDASFAAVPLYDALVKSGCHVHVMGNRPHDPLALRSPHYIEADYSDPCVVERTLSDKSFDFLVPGCNDLSYATCSALGGGKFYGLERSDQLACLHQKDQFRALCAKLGLPSPMRYHSVDDAVASTNPIIIKPVDGFSGRGIATFLEPDPDRLNAALASAKRQSPSGKVLLEHFVSGNLHSFSAFLRGGRVSHAFSVSEFSSVNPFVVDTSYVLFDNRWEATLAQDLEKIAAETGIDSGLMHVQYIATEEQYWLIEITRRCPGDLYSKLIHLSTGYPYAEAYVSSFVGGMLPRNDNLSNEIIVRHTVTGDESGYFDSVSIDSGCKIDAWFPLVQAGAHLKPSPGGRVGVGFMRANDIHHRDILLEKLLGREVFGLRYAPPDTIGQIESARRVNEKF